MSSRIRLNGGGVTFEQDVLGGIDTHQKTIPWPELNEYEVKIGSRGWAPMDEVFDYQPTNNGGVEEISMEVEAISSVEPEIRPRSERLSESEDMEVPPVPEVGEFDNETHRRFYERMRDNEGSQPATMRRIIHAEQELPREVLSRRMKEEGYEPSGGGFGASLVVLDEVTEEIRREGSGDDTRIIWVGNPSQ